MKPMLAFFSCSLFFVFCFLLFFSCQAKPPAHITDPGQLIFLGYTNKEANCSRCHGEEGQGGMFGPEIRGVLQKKGADYVRETITRGKGEGDNKMPSLAGQLTSAQIEQVLRYLSTWSDSSNAANPIELNEAKQEAHEQRQENRPNDGLALPYEHLE